MHAVISRMLKIINTESSSNRPFAQDVHFFFLWVPNCNRKRQGEKKGKGICFRRESAVEELHTHTQTYAGLSRCTRLYYIKESTMQGLTFGLGSTKDGTLMFISLWYVVGMCVCICVQEGETYVLCAPQSC